MPLYEYRCGECNKVFEVIQKFSDEPLKSCEACGALVEKLMSRTSFQLKGSGWYATDYKKSTAPSPAATKSESTAPSTSPTTSPGTPASATASNSSPKTETSAADSKKSKKSD